MQMKKKMKKKGFILLPVIMGVIILGILGVGLTSLYTGTFSTLSAGKAASQAQNNAQIESEMIRVRGYDDAKAHDWQDMKAYLGDEEGEKWASKVEKVREEKDQENRNVKIMKVSVKKNGEIISRYSEEIPLVQGLDVYTKDEMDALLNQLHTEINNVNTDLQDFKVSTNKNFATINKQIDQINKNLDTLSNRITAEEKARKNEDAAIRADIANKYSTIQTQITSLKDSLNDLKSALNKEISDRKTADTNLKNDYTSKITNLANTVNTKYSYLETLIQGLKGRLDGNEFVKSKAKQNISLQYLQGAGESKKTIHAFVDGVDVPLSSQSGIDDSPTPDKFTDEGGYYKFPNGLVMQWGKIKRDNSRGHINFSIKFPHKLLYVSTQSSAISIHAVANAIYNRTLTGFDYVVDTTSGGGDPNGTGWFAIGY